MLWDKMLIQSINYDTSGHIIHRMFIRHSYSLGLACVECGLRALPTVVSAQHVIYNDR